VKTQVGDGSLRTGPTPAVVVAWAATAVAVTGAVIAVALTLADHGDASQLVQTNLGLGCELAVVGSALGAFLLTRDPSNRIGALLVVTGVSRGVAVAATAWADHVVLNPGSGLGGFGVATWLGFWAFLPSLAVQPAILVLFPDGRLPGRRWWPVLAVAAADLLIAAGALPLLAWSVRGPQLLPTAPEPPLGSGPLAFAALAAAAVLGLVGVVAGLASLVWRWRGSAGDTRQCVKWLLLGGAVALVADLAGFLPHLAALKLLGPPALFGGLGIGVFRYRLYDVDRLINRTFVYGAVSVLAVAAYAAVVVTVGTVSGRGGSVFAGSVAAFTVALALRPVSGGVQRAIDRRFDRRTFDAVGRVRRFTGTLAQGRPGAGALPALLTEILDDPSLRLRFVDATGHGWLDAWGAAVDDVAAAAQGREVTTVGRGNGRVHRPAGSAAEPGRDIVCTVVHRGVAAADRPLFTAVIAASSVAFEHARLQAELGAQLEVVAASRTRIVAAADAERRRVERDIHDGAQQRLVGLALHLQSARRQTAVRPDDDVLGFTVEQLQLAVAELRELAQGILPSTLVTGGLRVALAELALRSRSPVEVDVDTDGAVLAEPVLAAAWFVVCEALANAAKHATGAVVHVQATASGNRLVVEVSDDGPGGADCEGSGLRGLADRVDALRGTFDVASPWGRGTTVRAVIPCG
jgi:signal transduction histidine kinase